jgi:hypothetical protein
MVILAVGLKNGNSAGEADGPIYAILLGRYLYGIVSTYHDTISVVVGVVCSGILLMMLDRWIGGSNPVRR